MKQNDRYPISNFNPKALRTLRQAHGIKSARDMARQIGVPQGTYARAECIDGPDVPLRLAWVVADYLGVTIDAVVGRKVKSSVIGTIQVDTSTMSRRSINDLQDFITYLNVRDAMTKGNLNEIKA